jgi:hypothetical protein
MLHSESPTSSQNPQNLRLLARKFKASLAKEKKAQEKSIFEKLILGNLEDDDTVTSNSRITSS